MNALHDVALAVSNAPEPTLPQTTPETTPYLLGDLLAEYLTRLGIEVAFGVPGGGIEPVLDALARSERRGGIRPVIARHETGAAFMADGYARETGKLGVCFATTGPGATNLITGVANSYVDDIPLLVLTGQTLQAGWGQRPFQDSSSTGIDIVSLFEQVTVFNSLVSHRDQFEPKLISAILAAARSNKPVHLALPLDVMASPPGACSGPAHVDVGRLIAGTKSCDDEAVALLAHELLGAKRICFLLGRGAAGCRDQIISIAGLVGAQLVVTPHAAGLLPLRTPSFQGVVGFGGHQHAIRALEDSQIDTIVAIGAEFDEMACAGLDKRQLLGRRLIQVDRFDRNFSAAPGARLHVQGTIDVVLTRLNELLRDSCNTLRNSSAVDSIRSSGEDREGAFSNGFAAPVVEKALVETTPITPLRLMYELRSVFPESVRYCLDVGNSMIWGVHGLSAFATTSPATDDKLSGEAGSGLSELGIHNTMQFGAMGWAIGASIGMAIARPDRTVVCVTGDGSLLMNGQELTVAREQNLNIVFVVLNDSALGMVMHGQQMAHAEQIGTDIPFVDLAALARSLGVESYTVTRPGELLGMPRKFLVDRHGPLLLDARVDRAVRPPMAARVRELSVAKR